MPGARTLCRDHEEYIVTLNGEEKTVRLGPDGLIQVDGLDVKPEVRRLSPTAFCVMLGDRPYRVLAARDREAFDVVAGAVAGKAIVESERDRLMRKYARAAASTGHKREIHAPMPALIVKVEVHVGQQIKAGEPLLVLEAMKMENEIRSHQAGTVKEIYVKPGNPIEKGQLLLTIE